MVQRGGFLKMNVQKKIVIEKIEFDKVFEVLKLPAVWLLMLIIMCAYMGYKTTDVISLYGRDVMQYSHVKSAKIATFLLYARPVIAIFIVLFLNFLF